jgi:hypothetical protein
MAVVVRATFDDELNNIHLNNQWQVRAGVAKDNMANLTFADWSFMAVVGNLNNAVVVFSGMWVDKGGKQHQIPRQILVGSNNTIFISDTQLQVTATIDASQVSFVPPKTDGVYQVVALVADFEAPVAGGANPLANATTLVFNQNAPSTQYFQTVPIDIGKTPTFYYQYTYTAIADHGARTRVTDAWEKPQSTVSTALPVVAGEPPKKPAAAMLVDAKLVHADGVTPPLDQRTQRLLALHNSFCRSHPIDLQKFLAT